MGLRNIPSHLAACFALALSACGPAKPVNITSADLHRAGDSVEITWAASEPNAPIDVYLLEPNGKTVLLSDDDTDLHLSLDARSAASRPIVRLVSASGSTRELAERILPLQGGRNFRDLGGYRTHNGEQVRWGKLYRSGSMTGLTHNDFALLRSLNISTICDLRSTPERETEPTNWQFVSPTLSYQVRDYISDNSAITGLLAQPAALTPETAREAFLAMYRKMPYEHAKSYRQLFLDIRDGRLPLAFNCSAGKDRSGVAAALILSALGVPRETILEDYALSDKVFDYERLFAQPDKVGAKAQMPAGFEVFSTMTPEQRAPFLQSDPAYIEAALDEIVRRDGSLDAYYIHSLGLTGADIKVIRAHLLEPAS